MLGKVAKVAALFLAGPALAFAVLIAGCEGQTPGFGVMCGHNIVISLVVFTFAAWFVLGSVNALVQALRRKE